MCRSRRVRARAARSATGESIAGDVAAAVVGESSIVSKPSMVSDLLAPVYGWFTRLARQVACLATNFETALKELAASEQARFETVPTERV